METTEIWDLTKARLQARHPRLTDDDFNCPEGSETEMLERIEQRLGISPMEMAALLEGILRDGGTSGHRGRPELLAGEAPPC